MEILRKWLVCPGSYLRKRFLVEFKEITDKAGLDMKVAWGIREKRLPLTSTIWTGW